ncbi:hypothetical protein B0H67DRAFT_670009 [Lasiosphaeris hirsuta]|uniref:Uncharacterized protein n=1 Tax=Lasiosphaeris hirsuta TaxID=260670 RepID=A0AA40DSW8_9PEZI|nr:hypothetical protein B0H67DRAFT_670009 [Lasiosphaeris hirsuta]
MSTINTGGESCISTTSPRRTWRSTSDRGYRRTKSFGRYSEDELLYYAHEVEKRHPDDSQHSAAVYKLLDEADRTCSIHGRSIGTHWTSVRDSPTTRGHDEYRESRECNFLALAIQTRLSGYVVLKLSDPRLM